MEIFETCHALQSPFTDQIQVPGVVRGVCVLPIHAARVSTCVLCVHMARVSTCVLPVHAARVSTCVLPVHAARVFTCVLPVHAALVSTCALGVHMARVSTCAACTRGLSVHVRVCYMYTQLECLGCFVGPSTLCGWWLRWPRLFQGLGAERTPSC